MFEKYGEFSTAEQINQMAAELRQGGDCEGVKALAEENGIDLDIVEVFLNRDIDYICDEMTAAIGKIEVEEKELKPQEIMADWTEYVKAQCMQDIQIAKNVRQKGKSLKGCIGQLLKWSWENSYNVDKDVIKAAGIKVKIVKMGIPGMGRAKKIIMEYYMN